MARAYKNLAKPSPPQTKFELVHSLLRETSCIAAWRVCTSGLQRSHSWFAGDIVNRQRGIFCLLQTGYGQFLAAFFARIFAISEVKLKKWQKKGRYGNSAKN